MCGAFVSSPVAVRKHHEESNSRKKGFSVAHTAWCRQSTVMEKSRQQEHKAPGYIITRIRKQRRNNECPKLLSVLSPSIDSRIPAKESCHPQLMGLPILVNVTKTIPLQ